MIWQIKTLDELGFVARGKSKHRPRGDKKLYGGKYPLIQTGDIQKTDFYISEYTNTYNDVGLAQSKLWKKGTLCLSIVGANTAESAILGFDACFPDSVIGFIANLEMSNEIFIKYYFDTMKLQMRKISDGGARENLSMEKLFTFKIPTPPVIIQNKIASILSSYDELIENNKQRIKLLEEMAEEIYKEWFVRLRFPDYENTTIVNGLPEGWENKSINSIVDIISGYAFKTEAFDSEGIYKLVTIKNVQDGFFVTQTTDYIYELPKNLKEDCKLKDKDIILSLTGNIGRICMVYGENYLLNQRVAKLKPKQENYFEFIYLMFRSSFLRATLENLSNGAAQQNLSPIEMGKLEFPIPSDDIIDMLSITTKSFFDQIITLNKENYLLQETRDLLLPRLISGKLSIEHLLEQNEELLMVAEPKSEYK
jgi:type I restriction enzyme S subunit